MGLTTLELEVANVAAPEASRTVEFVIDSGAVYSFIPERILRELGITPLAEEVYRLANGGHIVRRKGVALFRYAGRIGGADVVFGEEDDATLLGATTLESLGLALDPVKRELKPIPLTA